VSRAIQDVVCDNMLWKCAWRYSGSLCLTCFGIIESAARIIRLKPDTLFRNSIYSGWDPSTTLIIEENPVESATKTSSIFRWLSVLRKLSLAIEKIHLNIFKDKRIEYSYYYSDNIWKNNIFVRISFIINHMILYILQNTLRIVDNDFCYSLISELFINQLF